MKEERVDKEKIASEIYKEKQAKLAKRREQYHKGKASETSEQKQAKLAERREGRQKKIAPEIYKKKQTILAKRRDQYRERKASETSEQKQERLAKRRQAYQKKKASRNILRSTVQATCSTSESDSPFSVNIPDKNQYLREFDADKNGEIHMQEWAKVNISKFHKSIKYITLQCTICKEAWPVKATKRSSNKYVCLRCSRDKKSPPPLKFSTENAMTPSQVPSQLRCLT